MASFLDKLIKAREEANKPRTFADAKGFSRVVDPGIIRARNTPSVRENAVTGFVQDVSKEAIRRAETPSFYDKVLRQTEKRNEDVTLDLAQPIVQTPEETQKIDSFRQRQGEFAKERAEKEENLRQGKDFISKFTKAGATLLTEGLPGLKGLGSSEAGQEFATGVIGAVTSPIPGVGGAFKEGQKAVAETSTLPDASFKVPEAIPIIGGSEVGVTPGGVAQLGTSLGLTFVQYNLVGQALSKVNSASKLGKLLGGSKKAKFTANQLVDLAADAIIQTPQEIITAIREDDTIGEAIKTILFNRTLDVVFNAAVGGFLNLPNGFKRSTREINKLSDTMRALGPEGTEMVINKLKKLPVDQAEQLAKKLNIEFDDIRKVTFDNVRVQDDVPTVRETIIDSQKDTTVPEVNIQQELGLRQDFKAGDFRKALESPKLVDDLGQGAVDARETERVEEFFRSFEDQKAKSFDEAFQQRAAVEEPKTVVGKTITIEGEPFRITGESGRNYEAVDVSGEKTFIPKVIADAGEVLDRPVGFTKGVIDDIDFENVVDFDPIQKLNPELKPFIVRRANELLDDIDQTVKGVRRGKTDAQGEDIGTFATKKRSSETINEIQLRTGGTYKQIEDSLNRIVKGESEFFADKRIELIIHDNLEDGYKTFNGDQIGPNTLYKEVVDVDPPIPYEVKGAMIDRVEELKNVPLKADSKPLTPYDDINILKERQLVNEELSVNKLGTSAIDTPERNILREDIKDALNKNGSFSGEVNGVETFNGPVLKNKEAYIVIGPPAAGKSSVFANPLSAKYSAKLVDSDMAKELLPEFNGGAGAGFVHLESADIASEVFLDTLAKGENVVYPRVGKSDDSMNELIDILKENGYTVHLKLNTLSPEEATKRAIARYYSQGRYVEPDYVFNTVSNKPDGVYDRIKNRADTYEKYSNEVARGEEPVFIEYKDNGGLNRGKLNDDIELESFPERVIQPPKTQAEIAQEQIRQAVAPKTSESKAATVDDDSVFTFDRGSKRAPSQAVRIETLPEDTLIANIPGVKTVGDSTEVANILSELPKKGKSSLGRNFDRFMQELDSKYRDIEKASAELAVMSSNINRTQGMIESNVIDAQADMDGNAIGKSVKEIFKKVKKKEKKQLFEYLFHKHNIDRFAQGKPVFGDTVTSEVSTNFVKNFEANNPNLTETGNDIRQYFRNLMNEWAVKSGMTSKETAGFLNDLYPNYVPTLRAKDFPKNMQQGNRIVGQMVKRATGGSGDLLPIDETMIAFTEKFIKNAKKNELLNTMADGFTSGEAATKGIIDIRAAEDVNVNELFDIGKHIDFDATVKGDEYLINFYKDGQPLEMVVDKNLYDALKPANFDDKASKVAAFVRKYATGPFKSLITEYNPLFSAANVMRDVPTALIYSDNALKMMSKVPEATKEMLTNGAKFKQFKAMGGTREGLIGAGKNFKVPTIGDTSGFRKIAKQVNKLNPIKKISDVNNFTETLPRFSEYLAVLEKTGDPALAIYKSAELTTDFARKGDTTKLLDSFMPYLNPQVQGISRFVRSVSRGDKKTILKQAIGGVGAVTVPTIILDQINKDDEAFNSLPARERNLYFNIPYTDKDGERKFLRIPKSREMGVAFSSIFEWTARAARGEKVTGKEIVDTIKENFAISPSPVWTPAVKAWNQVTNPESYQTNYWDALIVPASQRNYSPGEQYDLNSSGIAKKLGQLFNISPFVVDYLMDSYGGVVADFYQPLSSDREFSITSPIEKRFINDPVFKNQSTTNFYDLLDKTRKEQKDFERRNQDQLAKTPDFGIVARELAQLKSESSRLNKVAKQLSELRKIIKGLQVQKGKQDEIRELQKEINELSKEAVGGE